MPELPEVETIARELNPLLKGKTIQRVEIFGVGVFRNKKVDYSSFVEGKKIHQIIRKGKNLYIQFESQSYSLLINLGMTGRLLWLKKSQPKERHTHLIFHLDSPSHELRYADIRRFGWLEIIRGSPKEEIPDAWSSSENEIIRSLRKHKGMIKHALLNQNIVAGLGNIYVDESLYRAQIHPRTPLEKLGEAKFLALVKLIREILSQSIQVGGTSVRNFVNAHGKKGGFKEWLRVYGKEGTACPCGRIIKKTVVAGRGTHFCPGCQRIGSC